MQYTTILHPVRQQLKLSCNDYCIADMIDLLATPESPVPGWCHASRGYMADEMNLSRQSVITIIQKLVGKGLVEENESYHLRTTGQWKQPIAAFRKVLEEGVKKVDTLSRNLTPTQHEGCQETLQGVKKLDTTCQESLQGGCQETLQEGVKNLDTYNKSDNKIGDNKSNTASSAESAGATAEPETDAVDEKKGTPINPVARPPSSPELPVPKKIPGDGRLRKLVGDFYREHPDLYPVEMYAGFINHWTLPVLNSQYEQDIGKEQWQTSRTFDIPKKLAKWHEGYLSDQLKRHESATRSNQSTNGHHATARPRGTKTNGGKPVKRSPVITPDKLRRDGQSGGNTTQNGYGGTTVVDVDRGDYSVEDSAPE